MHYLICYDISDDRLRNRTAKVLERHGCWRLQRSVFLARDFSASALLKMQTETEGVLRGKAGKHDSVLCFPVERDLLADNYWLPAEVPEDLLTRKVYKLIF